MRSGVQDNGLLISCEDVTIFWKAIGRIVLLASNGYPRISPHDHKGSLSLLDV